MHSMIKTALNFRFLVIILSIGLFIVGIAQMHRMPMDLLPEFSPVTVEIQTEALGLPASEVEAMITVPLEEFLSGMPWLQEVSSRSMNSLSSIQLAFEPGTDLMKARQMVQERLIHSAALPNVSKPPAMLQPVSSLNRVLNISLSSASVPLIDLSVLAQWKIKPRLMGVPGVANVSIWGHRARQLQVQVDPHKLKQHGVKLYDVVEATGNGLWVTPLSFLQASTPGNGGFIDTPNQRFEIRHILPISSAEDLSRIAFARDDGSTVTLGEVANVVEGHAPLIGDAVAADDSRILFVVEKFPWANTINVTNGIDSALAALQPGLPDIEMNTSSFRAASFIEGARKQVNYLLLTGWMLAVVAWFLLLNWRAAFIGATVSAVSIAAAALVLSKISGELNLIIVTGLVVAIAVFVGDLTMSLDRMSRIAVADQKDSVRLTERLKQIGTAESSASLFGLIAAAFVCVAILMLNLGVDAFVAPLIKTCLVALAAALIVALVLTPALAILLPSTVSVRKPLPLRLARLTDALQFRMTRRIAFGVPFAVALVALLSIGLISTRLLPGFEERDLVWHLNMPPGTSQTELSRLADELLLELRGIEGIESAAAQVGRAIMSDSLADVNSTNLWIRLKDDADADYTLTAIEALSQRFPGLESRPTTFTAERLNGVFETNENTLITRVYGPDLEALKMQTKALATGILGIPGVKRADSEAFVESSHIEVEVDLDKARTYGLNPGDIRRSASIILAGLEVGNLFEDQKVFEVTVWGVPHLRKDISSVGAIPIETPNGQLIRLSEVADVRMSSAPSFILREGNSRRLDITVKVDDRDKADVADDIRVLISKVDFALEYHAEVRNDGSDGPSLLTSFGLLASAVLGVFLVLQAAFDNWRLGANAIALPAIGVGVIVIVSGLTGGISLGTIAAIAAMTYIATRLAVSEFVHKDEPGVAARTARQVTVLLVMAAFLAPAIVLGFAGGLHMIVAAAGLLLCGTIGTVAFALAGITAPKATGHEAPEPVEKHAPIKPKNLKKEEPIVTYTSTLLIAASALLLSPSSDAAIKETTHVQNYNPATVEYVDGSEVARIRLTRKAVARLGVETAPVVQAIMHEPIRRYGLVETGDTGGGVVVRTVPDVSESFTHILDASVRITGLQRGPGHANKTQGWSGSPLPRLGYFALDNVAGAASGLQPGDLVELFLPSTHDLTGVSLIPRSAFFYDEHGQGWVYCRIDESGLFERHPLTLIYFARDQIAFRDDLPVGATVVVRGAAELYGIEFKVGH